jgi:hypothetical protein
MAAKNNRSFRMLHTCIATSLFAATFLVFLPLAIDYAYSDSLNPGVYPRDSSPIGMAYKDWIANWWKNNASFKAAEHPRDHFSPERCNLDQKQRDPVYYLPDNLAGDQVRNCSVPSGKAILAPLITGSCWDDGTDPKLKTQAGLLECSKEGQQYGVVSATLDGRKLQNLGQYRATSNVFNITFAQDNAFQTKPGTFRAIADGFFVFLEPLRPGTHTLVLEQSVLNPIRPEYNFASTTTYHLRTSA